MNCNDQMMLNRLGKQFDKIAVQTTVQIDKCNHFQGSYLFIIFHILYYTHSAAKNVSITL